MKKIFFLLFTIAIISCKNEPKIDYAIISGTIKNASSDKLTLYNKYNTSDKKEIKLSKEGTFKDTIFILEDHLYMLRQDQNTIDLYVENGDDFLVTYDANDYQNTFDFSGEGAAPNKYLAEKNKLTTEILGDAIEVYKTEEEAFKNKHSEIKQAQEDFLFNYKGLSEEFKTSEKSNINYSYLTYLNNYPSYHEYYAKKEGFKPTEDFLKELDNLNYENEKDFKYSAAYRNLVSSKYSKDAQDLAKKDSIERDIAMLTSISNSKSELIKNKLLYEQAKYGITYTDNLEDYYAVYSSASTNEKNNIEINKSYEALKALAIGNVSPKFSDYENNSGGTTSLEDLKGKYIYIDVWATWCGPCIAEIPSLKKVEEEFHDKNIQFLSISIDDEKDHDKWKKMIVDRELGGMQLMADNNWNSKFITEYMIKGIPRFILLDKDLNIISANAPRPSDEKLVTILNDLNL